MGGSNISSANTTTGDVLPALSATDAMRADSATQAGRINRRSADQVRQIMIRRPDRIKPGRSRNQETGDKPLNQCVMYLLLRNGAEIRSASICKSKQIIGLEHRGQPTREMLYPSIKPSKRIARGNRAGLVQPRIGRGCARPILIR